MESAKHLIDGNVQYLFASARHTNVQCATHMHVTMEIVMVTHGCLTMTIDGKSYHIQQGQGAFVPPFATHSFTSAEENRCHVLMFSKILVPYFMESLQYNAPQTHVFPVSRSCMEIAEECLPHTKNAPDCITAQAVLAPLCLQIQKHCQFNKRTKPLQDTLTIALEYMDHHFTEELTLTNVAQAIGVHPVTLSKLFSRHCGVNFNFYLQYLRCSHAANLIKSKQISFSDAALSSGFGSIRSFNRAFQSIYGLTPSQYRRTDENADGP